MKIIKLLILLIFCFSANIINSQTYTVSGYVVDSETGETIIGTNVLIKGTYKGAITDINGYFRITNMPAGDYILQVSFISYSTKELKVTLKDRSLVLDDIQLVPKSFSLDEVSVVEIKAENFADPEVETSLLKMSRKAIQSIPTARNDVFKALKYLRELKVLIIFRHYFRRGAATLEEI